MTWQLTAAKHGPDVGDGINEPSTQMLFRENQENLLIQEK